MSIRDSFIAEERLGLPDVGVRAFDVSAEQAASLVALAIDAILIVLTSALTGIAYQRIALGAPGDLTVLLGTGAIVAAIFCALMRLTAAADPLRVSSGFGRAGAAVTAWVLTFLFLGVLAFALKISDSFSRGSIFCFFIAGQGVVIASRVLAPRLLSHLGASYALRGTDAILIGPEDSREASSLAHELRRQGCGSIHVVSIDVACEADKWDFERHRVIDRTLSIARTAAPGPAYIAAPGLDKGRLADLIAGLRLMPRSIRILPEESVAQLLHYAVRKVGTSISLEMQREPLTLAQRAVKRAIDIALASLALLVLAPLLLVVAFIIKLDSPGPVMFRQVRIGRGGRPFRIVKFRTMHVMEDGADVCQAVRRDCRVTRSGRFLRSTSLDELPQLLNVLFGEMSLVGPRPHARAHDEYYATLIENYQVRQHVKPGLTGWAQINGFRGETPTVDLMHRRIQHDLWYAANAGLSLDFLILLRTVPALFGHRNAY